MEGQGGRALSAAGVAPSRVEQVPAAGESPPPNSSEARVPITDEIRTLALERCSVDELHADAVSHGMRTMHDDGIEKVSQGLTTLTEIARVSRSL